MKKKLFLALSYLTMALSLHADDFCYADCSSDCFGFDSVLTFDVGGGYRNDSLSWKIFPSNDVGSEIEEKWKNIGLGIVEANAQFLACEHYLLKVDFDFGWFSNNGSQRFFRRGGVELPSNLKSKPRGNAYNLSGGIGYQFNFDCLRVSFAPLVGYSCSQQRFKSRKYENELNPALADVLAHNSYKFRWSGPWVGFALAYQATCELQLYFDYYYHWIRFHGTARERFILGHIENRLHSNNGYGNEFTVGGTYTFCDYWYIGVKFDYKQYCGNKGKSTLEEMTPTDPSFKIETESPFRKLNWDSSTITLDIGYTF